MKIAIMVLLTTLLLFSSCSLLEENLPEDIVCKQSYERFMETRGYTNPVKLLEYQKVSTLSELKAFEKDFEVPRTGDFFSPSQRYGGMTGRESDFKPTYAFAVRQEPSSTNSVNAVTIIHLCICDGTVFSCGNRL